MSFFIYNPGQKSKKESIAEFILHRHEYEDLLLSLERSTMDFPSQHYMIVGQRGMGKTTLLRRLQIGIEDSDKLKDWLIPVLFTEEQYQITSLVDLWEYVAEYLEDLGEFSGLTAFIQANRHQLYLDEKAFEVIRVALQTKGKKLVLLLDSLGDLFKKFEPLEMHRLRAILQTENCIRIIGGSTSLEGLWDYHKPFYEFFKIIRLESLGAEEAVQFILQLAEARGESVHLQKLLADYPGRVETLRILTGGVPRTIAILFGIFLDKEHDEAIKDLYSVLDLVTPLYKHRMDDLPVQQQKIMDAVARHWEPITVKELAERTHLVSKTLSAQLNAMEKDQLIIKHDTHNKNKTYQIRERFWNIWYLMRYGRKDDRANVVWLVKFLETWLTSEDLEKRVESFVNRVKEYEIFNKEQLTLFSRVYASMNNLTIYSKMMLKEIENETLITIPIIDDELQKSAVDSFERGDVKNSMRYFFQKSDMAKPDSKLFLELLGTTAFPNDEDDYFELDYDFNPSAYTKQVFFLHVRGFYAIIRAAEVNISEKDTLYLLEVGLWAITIDVYVNCLTVNEYGVALAIVSLALRTLIDRGLYKVALSIFESASSTRNESEVFLKDLWKPLHLALKYLYQPTELEKQPAELREPAERIVKDLLGLEK